MGVPMHSDTDTHIPPHGAGGLQWSASLLDLPTACAHPQGFPSLRSRYQGMLCVYVPRTLELGAPVPGSWMMVGRWVPCVPWL